MPIYEYRCKSCHVAHEKMGKYDDPPPPCPECEGETSRIMSRGSFHLKGSGWYETDYKKKT